MKSWLTWVLLAGMAAGCVSKSKYNALQSEYDAAVGARDQAVAERDKALEGQSQASADAEKARQAMDRRTQAFVKVYETLLEIREQKLAKVRVDDGRAVLQLESDVLFPSGSATLTKGGRDAVQKIAKALAAGEGRFQVEGHTDSDPVSSKTFPSNWHLGAARAIEVVSAMTAAGMPAERLSAASYGDIRPVAANDNASGKAENRRIELVWMPDLSDALPYKRMIKEIKKSK